MLPNFAMEKIIILENKIKVIEQQISDMKNCENCKHGPPDPFDDDCLKCKHDSTLSNWKARNITYYHIILYSRFGVEGLYITKNYDTKETSRMIRNMDLRARINYQRGCKVYALKSDRKLKAEEITKDMLKEQAAVIY